MENARLGEVLNDTFPVTTGRGKPVNGLLDKDFQKLLYGPDGAELSADVPITISELGNGMYRLNFRPNKIGQWLVTISHQEHCPGGLSETYQVDEGEAALEEVAEESNPTPYVILRHWPDSPTPDLMEHWDIKLKNPQGTMYEWSSMDDPFETADGILGETIDCCSGEKALELEGEIELAPGSPWNQTKVLAHLGLIQSGQVHFITEEPGLVIAYLDQLPFRAVQEGDSDEWDITLGVWAAMSKERYIKLMAMPVDEYNPTELPDPALDDDWRVVTSWLAAIRVGVEVDKTENEAQCYLKKIVQEIGNRGRATFNLSKMGEAARAMLADTLWNLYGKGGKGIYEPQQYAEMIAEGTKTMKLEQKPWDLAGFYGLIDGKNVIGMVRFEDREELYEEDFEKRKAEHKLSKDEIHAWGWQWPVYAWKIREYVSLDKPKALDSTVEWARKDSLMAEDHKFSSTQLDLPTKEAAAIREISESIPEAEIYTDPDDPSFGREENPHITVKFGLHTDNPDELRRLLKNIRPITVTLKTTSIFESEDYDVVKIDVDSPQLHALNKKISDEMECTDTHPEYRPHVTLAYVKKGEGKKYIDDASVDGIKMVFDTVIFSGKDGTKTAIPVELARKGAGLAMENDEIYAELRTLVEHTKDELERAGLFDEDSDYGGMLADAVMAIMKVFSKQGHSGFSAQMCRELFQRLSNFETLTPITSEPEEWNDVSEMCVGGTPMWQNERNPAIFSEDGGKTWYNVETQSEDGFKTSTDHDHWHIWFPGRPRTSGKNGHDHAIDEEKGLALKMNNHTHTLLKEPA